MSLLTWTVTAFSFLKKWLTDVQGKSTRNDTLIWKN